VIALPENEKDYSDYHQIRANTINILVLLSGFTFTAITILLSQYSALSSLTTQLVLFFLTSLFFMFMFLLAWFSINQWKYVRNLPPVTREIAVFNRLVWLSYFLLQLAVVLMFLIWNLVYLSLASGILLAIFIILHFSVPGLVSRISNESESKT